MVVYIIMGFWRNLYYYAGWEYKPTETTEKIKRDRHEVMVQIRSFGDNIKDIVLGEEGEIRDATPRVLVGFDARASTPTLDIGVLENEDDFIIDSITDYTRLFEGIDIPKKKRRKRKRNKISF
jgi:hypothetical protein